MYIVFNYSGDDSYRINAKNFHRERMPSIGNSSEITFELIIDKNMDDAILYLNQFSGDNSIKHCHIFAQNGALINDFNMLGKVVQVIDSIDDREERRVIVSIFTLDDNYADEDGE